MAEQTDQSVVADRCTAVAVLRDPVRQIDRVYTCAQRAGHDGDHNERLPGDGCTAWADHCPVCAEHDCVCAR